MSKVRFTISMSLDGFVAGADPTVENPLGIGGEDLHEWVTPLAFFKEIHGESGGVVNKSNEVLERNFENLGATIMGRNMFGGGPGPWSSDPPWIGWWGEEPPFHHPVFVLTHHTREALELKGTTFHFVTDIESALDQAKRAANGKDVAIAGGANVAQQYIAAGLVDEMTLSVAPIFLKRGSRLFDDLGERTIALEQVEAIEAPGVTHIRYRLKA